MCYMDENMTKKSFGLATKLFRPKPKEDRRVLGGAVKKWNEQVLDEHGLRAESFSGAVSGSGPEVSTGITGRFRRELSIPHLVNRAAIDGTGMSSSPASSKNAECRAMLKKAEKVIQLFNRSKEDKVCGDQNVRNHVCVTRSFVWSFSPTGIHQARLLSINSVHIVRFFLLRFFGGVVHCCACRLIILPSSLQN